MNILQKSISLAVFHHRDNNNFKSVQFFYLPTQFFAHNSIKNPKSFIENPSKSKMILFNKQNRCDGSMSDHTVKKTEEKKERKIQWTLYDPILVRTLPIIGLIFDTFFTLILIFIFSLKKMRKQHLPFSSKK